MDTLIRILRGINEDIAWMEETALIEDRILDSLAIVTLIADLEEAFDVEIRAEEITSENFNSVETIWTMVCRLQGR